MKYRQLGRTGFRVSEIGMGTWGIGAGWGTVDDETSLAALHRAVDRGVTFFDTADVYGGGRSEKLLARLRRQRREPIVIATKIGRRFNPQTPEQYTAEAMGAYVEESLERLETGRIDLLQLHCPPTEAYYRPEIWEALDDMVKRGRIAHYGVSVRNVEEALKAIEYPGVETVQIIFNLFRHRPAELFFREAARRRVGVIVRVPLASGLLTGRMRPDTTFEANDHRLFNREGQSFDRGETFSGVDYATGLEAVEELRALLPQGMSLAQFALRWILMFEAVSTVIAGAKSPAQVDDNTTASDLPPLADDRMAGVRRVYDRHIRAQVHGRW